MLADFPICFNIPAADMTRARQFYTEKLGLTPALGVTFEEYDWPWLKTVNGVANLEGNLLAWFKDSEGNLLALAQIAASAR